MKDKKVYKASLLSFEPSPSWTNGQAQLANMMFFVLSCLVACACAQQQGGYQENYQGGYQQQGNYQQQQQPQQKYQAPPSYQQYDATTRRPSYAPPTGLLHNQGIDGSYRFAYQTKDGQTRAESTGADGGIKGSYTYTSPEGQKVQVSYTADQHGFQASSDAIPKAPIPAAAPAPQRSYQEPSYQSYQAPQQQYQAPPQYKAPPQQYKPPSYPEQSYDYSHHQPRGGNSGAPTAQYSFGDPSVLSNLQNLFG